MITTTLVIGGKNAGEISKRQGKGYWNGFTNYINDNWSQTFGIEMAIFIVSIGVSELFKNHYTDCFIAGTLVLTSSGLVKIEDIKVGDEVWAYNEETKEKSLKKVVNLFRKETKEWMHLFIENPITKKTEEIICTPSHRIYIEGKGWIISSEIVENDEALLYNNIRGIVKKIELEKLESIDTTYNFEVEDYHNYFVSEESVLVHNDCISDEISYDNSLKNDLEFKSRELLEKHFCKHNKDFYNMYNNADEYLAGANNAVKNGTYVPELNGYKLYYRLNSKGQNLYYFVGITRTKPTYITTYFPRVL